MPPQGYQGSAALATRDLLDSNGGSELNGKNVALIIFVAIVPVLIVAGVVGWLLCCYSRGRGCGRRKREDKTTPTTTPGGPTTPGANAPAVEKTGWMPMAMAKKAMAKTATAKSLMAKKMPSRPAPTHTRNDSMLSGRSNLSSQKSNEKGPTMPRGFV